MARRGSVTGGRYERIQDKLKRTGEYELVLPFDRLVMEILPVEGTTAFGLYEIGLLAIEIREKLGLPPEITPESIGGRLRTLEAQGLARKVKLVGGKRSGSWAWQKTQAAVEYLNKEG